VAASGSAEDHASDKGRPRFTVPKATLAHSAWGTDPLRFIDLQENGGFLGVLSIYDQKLQTFPAGRV